MKYDKSVICFLLIFSAIISAPYEELIPDFNRKKSPAMVRKITKSTLANLDYAAYSENPIRYDPEKFKPKPPEKNITVSDITFDNNLTGAVNSLIETPLTEQEKEAPMAWAPLQNLLWSELKIDDFKRVGSKIIGYKWADPDIFKPYQEIAACYVHSTGSGHEIWVKIEFSHWVHFLSGITDENQDGFFEIYGKLNIKDIKEEIQSKVIEWIKNNYQQGVLTEEKVVDWITVLASYWYPTLNTDIVDMGEYTHWPNEETERKVRKKTKSINVRNPVAVMRGMPFKKPLYNVFIVEGMGEKKKKIESSKKEEVSEKVIDTALSQNYLNNNKRFSRELKPYGDYPSWYERNSAFVNNLTEQLNNLPQSQMGITGVDDWLFFRNSLTYAIATDLCKQTEDKNPLPYLIALKKYLDAYNVNLLFVAVPTKAEVYYDKLGIKDIGPAPQIYNPYGRKVLYDIQKSGIEVIDLLHSFLSAKREDSKHTENVYQRQDTHWTNRGLQITAELIAERIKMYSWYNELEKDRVTYNIVDTTFERIGDIVDRLPEMEKINYKAVTMKAQQVKTLNGKLYKGDRSAPIMLIGDSFTGVFELIDCKGAGIGAHIAAKTGLPVDIITSWGGGPLVRNKMIRIRKDDMQVKRLVIYLMAARDLYNYTLGWEELKIK